MKQKLFEFVNYDNFDIDGIIRDKIDVGIDWRLSPPYVSRFKTEPNDYYNQFYLGIRFGYRTLGVYIRLNKAPYKNRQEYISFVKEKNQKRRDDAK